MKPLKLNWREERLRQENARLPVLLRAIKTILPLAFKERIEEELKGDEPGGALSDGRRGKAN